MATGSLALEEVRRKGLSRFKERVYCLSGRKPEGLQSQHLDVLMDLIGQHIVWESGMTGAGCRWAWKRLREAQESQIADNLKVT